MRIYTTLAKSISYNILENIKSLWSLVYGWALFLIENSKKRYKYVLLGEKHSIQFSDTILQYRVIGKRHTFEMSAKNICNSKNMISGFHPLDIRIISFIAGVDQVLDIDKDKRATAFNKIKKEIEAYE